MIVKDLLRRKGDRVVTVPPGTSVHDVLGRLAEYNLGALVVSADGDRVDGIVSERDVVRALHTGGATVLERPVSEIMTTRVTTTTPGDNLDVLSRLMTDQRIRHLPVVVDGRLTGIISIGDVVKGRIDELEHERESLIGYIHSGS